MKVYQVGPDDPGVSESEANDFEWVVHWYEYGSYEGDGEAVALCKADGLLYVKNLGHCSCYEAMDGGLLSGDKITIEEFLRDKDDIHAFDSRKEIKDQVALLVRPQRNTGERAAFIRTIIENPEEDTPRLVFADWLEENGEEERAYFIRFMIQDHSRIYQPYQDCVSMAFVDVDHPRRVNYGILDNHNSEWFPFDYHTFLHTRWHRGFVMALSIKMDDWLKYGPAICAEHPIERVEITDKQPEGIGENSWWVWESEEYLFDRVSLGDRRSISHAVPKDIFNNRSNPTIVSFEVKAEALEWLSDRCIDWAKAQSSSLSPTPN